MELKCLILAGVQVVQIILARSRPESQRAVDVDHQLASGVDTPDLLILEAVRQKISDGRSGWNSQLLGTRDDTMRKGWRLLGSQFIGQRNTHGDLRLRNETEIRRADFVERLRLERDLVRAHGSGERAVLLRSVQRFLARCCVVLPALAGVVVRVQRVVVARVERDTGKGVGAAGFKCAPDTSFQILRRVLKLFYQRVHSLLRMLGGAVFLRCCDVSFRVLREQTVIQILCVRSLAVEHGPAVGGVFFLNEGTVAQQRLMKSCRVDLRRWDQVCDSFG